MTLFRTVARRRRPLVVAAAALLVVASIATVLLIVGRIHPSRSGVVAVSAGFDDCGAGWTSSRGGAVDFAVSNSTIAGEDVYLEDVAGRVYGEVEGLGSNGLQHLPVVLGDGRYRFVCIPAESDPIRGPIVRVANARHGAAGSPAIPLVTRAELLPAARQYETWVASRLPVLQADARDLDDALRAGDAESARRAWLTTHVEYETLGAAYGAFGDADAAIDGTPAPGRTALDDPDLTGLHRIEALLWSGAAPQSVEPVAARLVVDVDGLASALSAQHVDAIDVGLRAHEILENAIRFELTDADDAGSGTQLATIAANLDGTREALDPLLPLLRTRYPDLETTRRWLDRSAALVAGFQRPDGSWTPLGDIPRPQREVLDATLDRTVELLAPVAAICDPRTADR